MARKEETYVCTLADCGTIREAAEKLFISPSALSTYIKSLEKDLGVPLFYRLKQGFKPTPMGQKYIQRCRQILELDQDFQEELSRYKNSQKNEFTIGMYRLRGLGFKGPLLIRLREQLPELAFKIVMNAGLEQNRLLYEGALDYILTTSPLPPTGKYQYICDDTLVLACPATWHMPKEVRSSNTVALDDIDKAKILLPAEWQSIYTFIKRYFQDNQQSIGEPTTLNNMEIAIQCVAAGIGCCFTLQSYVSAFSWIPNIRYYHLKGLSFKVPWYLEYLNENLSSDQLRTLVECIRTEIQSSLDAF